MSSSKKEMFHNHESDALRLIKAAQAGAEEANEKPNVDILKPTPEIFKRKKGGRPKKDPKDKSARTKRLSLYVSPEEHAIFKEFAHDERFSVNEVIVNSALMYIKRKREEQAKKDD